MSERSVLAGGERRVPDDPDLPEHQCGRWFDAPFAEEEVGRLIGLAPVRRRIDADVGKQAIFSGDARQHDRRVAFGARLPQRDVRGIYEHAGMPVERGAHAHAGSDARHDPLGHLVVGLLTLLALAVQNLERLDAVRVEGAQYFLGHRVADDVEHLVGRAYPGDRFGGEVTRGAQPGANDDQLSAMAVAAGPRVVILTRPLRGLSVDQVLDDRELDLPLVAARERVLFLVGQAGLRHHVHRGSDEISQAIGIRRQSCEQLPKCCSH